MKKKLKKNAQRKVICPHCGAQAVIRRASEIYGDPTRTDELYVCANYPACKAYVRMHPGTRVPMGTLANGDLRSLRIRAHRKFDEIWRSGIMDRNNAYRWMADALGLPLGDAHIGTRMGHDCDFANLPMYYVDLCEYAVRCVRLHLYIREKAFHAIDRDKFAGLMRYASPANEEGGAA